MTRNKILFWGAWLILVGLGLVYYWTSIPLSDFDFQNVQRGRREAVKNSFLHAWNGYSKYAWGHDELKPVSNSFVDPFGGFGATIIDGLDTMYIMGIHGEEYKRARDFTMNIDFEKDVYVGTFETTIRILGGLLGIYTLTNDRMYVTKAQEMADLLMPVFRSRSGLPYSEINLKTKFMKNPEWHSKMSILSEVGSMQLEFKYLSHLLNTTKYSKPVEYVMDVVTKQNITIPGLYPCYLYTESGEFSKLHVSFGALGDSFYEYLLKQYLLSSKTEPKYLELYNQSIAAMKEHLISTSVPNGLVYIAEMLNFKTKYTKFDHLVCFMGGTLALGSEFFSNIRNDLDLAKELVNTCYTLYKSTKTGIGPEIVTFDNAHDDFHIKSSIYLLRPELVESLVYLYRITGDRKYTEMGWEIYQSIEKHCKTSSGYSEIQNVNADVPLKNDGLQSFFFAETLKYLYLLFSDPSVLPFDQYVFNTEGHPFRMY